ncbi:MAG: SUMF1/EgtB/PvdO family nonheme iron enzyme [Gemmatimonadota bacterium]
MAERRETRETGVRLTTLGRLDLHGPDTGVARVLRQPKSLGVLVFLAVESREGFVRRDRVVGMFWPDLDHKRARAALRNVVYQLRRALPPGAIDAEGDEMLRVDPAIVRTDAVDFERAVDRGATDAALDLYRGDFMPGFHLHGASEFDAWRDGVERTYRRTALAGAADLAARAEEEGASADAIRWLEKAVAVAPYDEEPVQRLIVALLARGDRGAAHAVYRTHEGRLRHLELAPAAKTTELLTASDEPRIGPRLRPPSREASAAAAQVHAPARNRSALPRRSLRPLLAAAAGAVLLGVGLVGVARPRLLAHQAWTEGFAHFRADVARGDAVEAYERGRRLRPWLAGDDEFDALWEQITTPVTIRTNAGHATVSVQDYAHPDRPWVTLGTTPLVDVPLPAAYLRWRIERPGHRPVERAGFDVAFRSDITFDLPSENGPTDMAYVSGDALNPGAPVRARLQPYWMDRYEVTNVEYDHFVRGGGYRTVHTASTSPDDRLPGLSGFVDRSGLPGPSTWSGGTWPSGRDRHPVRGVSWFEAAAYCAWVGKELPTASHWFAAGGFAGYSDILTLANFSRVGPIAVGEAGAIGPYGHHDLAGNVREWVANEVDGGHAILGGAWDTPAYQFMSTDVSDPFDRSDHNGFRCARVLEGATHESREPLVRRRAALEAPAVPAASLEDRIDRFGYDATPLEARVDSTADGHPMWRREFVSFDAAYGDERMGAVVYMPRHGSPPFEPVVVHPGADATLLPHAASARTYWFDFLARGDYAVVYPVYKGTYERRAPISGPIGLRDRVVERVKDVRRALDYIESRDDLDGPITYYGFSQGAALAPLVAAAEPRIGSVVVLSGGLGRARLDDAVEPRHYLPHADRPLLMIGGELDFLFPFATAQRRYFEAWGSAEPEKRLVGMPFGHTPRDMRPVADEVLAWLAARTTAPTTDEPGS